MLLDLFEPTWPIFFRFVAHFGGLLDLLHIQKAGLSALFSYGLPIPTQHTHTPTKPIGQFSSLKNKEKGQRPSLHSPLEVFQLLLPPVSAPPSPKATPSPGQSGPEWSRYLCPHPRCSLKHRSSAGIFHLALQPGWLHLRSLSCQ